MKKAVISTALFLMVLLSGCNASEDVFLVVVPHQENFRSHDEREFSAVEDLAQLRKMVLNFIETGTSHAQLRTYVYETDLEQDLENVVNYAQNVDPMGAYAVSSITYDSTKIGSFYEITFDIAYRKTLSEIQAVKTAYGSEQIKQLIFNAVEAQEQSLTMRISNFSGLNLSSDIEACCYDNLDRIMCVPETSFEIYPAQGSVRVVDISFSYHGASQPWKQIQSAVSNAMDTAVSAAKKGENSVQCLQLLYGYLLDTQNYTLGKTQMPAYSMLCEGIVDSRAAASVLVCLCRKVDIPCEVVRGVHDGEIYYWNIVTIDAASYHVDLLQQLRTREQNLELHDAADMTGYIWDEEICSGC